MHIHPHNMPYTKSYTRRRAAKPKRRTYRKKRTTKKKAAARLTKKIISVSSEKKSDQLASAIKPAMGSDPSVVFQADFQMDGSIRIYGWTPSTMQGTDTKGAHVRNMSTIFFRGFREEFQIGSHSGCPIIHRRMIIGFTGNIDDMSLHDGDEPLSRFRNMDQVGLPSFIFKGTQNIDWIDPMKAKLDRDRVRVIHDKKRIISPKNDYGTEVTKKYWIPYNKKVKYADSEKGHSTEWNKWPDHDQEKIYIYDLIQSTQNTGSDPGGTHFGTFESNVTCYWHE